MRFPDINPIFMQIGPLKFRWYGLMYILSFITAFFFIKAEARRKDIGLAAEEIGDLVFYAAMGVMLGGRFGYVFFYNLDSYIRNPLKIFAVWEGGMSFHGGMLGVIAATLLFCHKKKIRFLPVIDTIVQCVPIGLFLGR